jgi:hypothetical protein
VGALVVDDLSNDGPDRGRGSDMDAEMMMAMRNARKYGGSAWSRRSWGRVQCTTCTRIEQPIRSARDHHDARAERAIAATASQHAAPGGSGMLAAEAYRPAGVDDDHPAGSPSPHPPGRGCRPGLNQRQSSLVRGAGESAIGIPARLPEALGRTRPLAPALIREAY